MRERGRPHCPVAGHDGVHSSTTASGHKGPPAGGFGTPLGRLDPRRQMDPRREYATAGTQPRAEIAGRPQAAHSGLPPRHRGSRLLGPDAGPTRLLLTISPQPTRRARKSPLAPTQVTTSTLQTPATDYPCAKAAPASRSTVITRSGVSHRRASLHNPRPHTKGDPTSRGQVNRPHPASSCRSAAAIRPRGARGILSQQRRQTGARRAGARTQRLGRSPRGRAVDAPHRHNRLCGNTERRDTSGLARADEHVDSKLGHEGVMRLWLTDFSYHPTPGGLLRRC